MEKFIKHLEIKNFKSIKYLALDCKRVNVFIGKPNVGKSNILEALGLFSIPLVKKISDLARFETTRNLFLDNDLSNKVEVNFNDSFCLELTYPNITDDIFRIVIYDKNFPNSLPLVDTKISRNGDVLWQEDYTILSLFPKYYQFKNIKNESWHLAKYLNPPYGENLFEIVTNNHEIRYRIVSMMKEQNLEFVSLIMERDFKLQKNIDGFVTQYPYSSIADTFQRFIFYLAAIESNSDSVLIFEEPEVHSFPPYVKELAERIAYKQENQFFVSTHSPYLLNTLISRLDSSELTVFLTYYKDYQTFVKPLSEESIQEARDLGVDFFYNLDRF